jgi:hypothetical protein
MKKSDYTSIIFCALILIISGIKWSIGLENHLDILLGDEAEYMRNGLDLFDKVAKNWGPTYNLWYKFLSIFNHHPIELYYINYKIGAIAVGVLLFILLVRYKVHLIVAFVIAYCYLFSDVNINAWPRVSNFVVILLLLYFIIIKNISSLNIKLILFACVTFIGAFARPELFIIAEICSVICILMSVYQYKSIKTNLPYLVLLFVIAFGLFFVYGKPADTYLGIDRMYIAFCQHYAVAYNIRTHSNNTRSVIEWIDFTRPIFGDCKNVPEILTKHFSLVIPHVLFVSKAYLMTFLTHILNFIFPLFLIHSIKKKLVLVALMFIVFGAVLFNENSRTTFFQKIKDNKVALLLAFIVSVPSIGICMIIFPRQHYIMMQTIWIALLLGFLFTSILENIKLPTYTIVPIAIVLLMISPEATQYNSIQSQADIKNLCTQQFVRFMNTQDWKQQHTIFSNILNAHFLFDHPENYKQFNTEYMLQRMPTNVRFADILRDHKIDIIFMNDAMNMESRLKNDTTWNNLTAHPEQYQFKKVFFGKDCQSYLLIKE